MSKKGLVTIAVLIFIVATVLAFAYGKSFHSPLPTSGGKFTVPEYVSVLLASSVENNKRVPVIFLSAVAGGGCDSASGLVATTTLSGNTLIVDIKGYDLIRRIPQPGEVCLAVILESRAKVIVDPDWLKQNGENKIIFRLNGRDNTYNISYSRYRVILRGVQASNVITNRLGSNPSLAPVSLEMTLYPIDVAVMYLAGSVSSEIDYRPAMRTFAQTKEFAPADQIYSGLEQNEKSQFYVVLKNRSMPEKDRGELLGNLPDESVSVFLKQVDSDSVGSLLNL